MKLMELSSEEILNDKAKAMSAISLVDGLIFASATTKFMRDEIRSSYKIF
ncbi:hypothetical protein [Escherichia coli]